MNLFTNFRDKFYIEVGNTVIRGVAGAIAEKLFKPKPDPLEIPPEVVQSFEENAYGKRQRR